MSKLKPCPFHAPIEGRGPHLHEHVHETVRCSICGAHGPACKTEREAADAWNKREPDATATALRELCEKWRAGIISRRKLLDGWDCAEPGYGVIVGEVRSAEEMLEDTERLLEGK